MCAFEGSVMGTLLYKGVFEKIWSLIPGAFRRKAKLFVLLSIFNMFLETLSLGMIVPLLLAISSHGGVASESKFTIFRGLNLQNFSMEIALFLLVGLFLLKNLYSLFMVKIQANFIFGLEESLSNTLLRRYLNQPYKFFVENNSSELIRNTVSEVSFFSHNAVAPLCGLISEVLVVFGIVLILFLINPYVTFIACFVLLFFGVSFHSVVKSRVSFWSVSRQQSESKRIQVIQESVGAIKEIKMYSKQDFFCKNYSLYSHVSSKAGSSQHILQAYPRLFIEVIAVILIALFVLMLGQSSQNLIAMLGLYATAAFRLMPSANRINLAFQAIAFSESTVNLLYREFSLPEMEVEVCNHDVQFNEYIKFDNVSFSYPNTTKSIFENVNLTLSKGDVIAVTGASGAGKSTLIDLICGFLKPTSGRVLVDNNDLEGKVSSWQKYIAYVPQNIFLIDASIKENILFGMSGENIDYEKFYEVIRICGVTDFVSEIPNGINAMIGERGSRLSGGQKQRIGLARALFRGAELLILDEATNALDALAEKEIVDSVIKTRKNMTVIWISHGGIPFQSVNKTIRVNKESVELVSKESI